MSEDSLFERVTAAAEERHLSQNTLTAYRRTWLKLIAWSAAEGLVLETLPLARASGAGAMGRQVMGYVVIDSILDDTTARWRAACRAAYRWRRFNLALLGLRSFWYLAVLAL